MKIAAFFAGLVLFIAIALAAEPAPERTPGSSTASQRRPIQASAGISNLCVDKGTFQFCESTLRRVSGLYRSLNGVTRRGLYT